MKDVKTFDARSQSFYALPRLRNVLSGCESARITDSGLCHSFSLSRELFMRSHDLNTKHVVVLWWSLRTRFRYLHLGD